jgi:hypothetical protein
LNKTQLYEHVPHPHIARRRQQGPVKVTDQLPAGTPVQRFNARFAVRVTRTVGTMWCAYIFAAIAFISLPSTIRSGSVQQIVAWVSQAFFQLVLLSIILVGQDVQAQAADKRAEQTYRDAEAGLAENLKIQEHLAAQDALLQLMEAKLGALLLRSWPEKRM